MDVEIKSITITGDSMSGSPEVAELFAKENNLQLKDLSKIVKESKCELSKIDEGSGKVIEKSDIDKKIDRNLVMLRNTGVVIEAKMAWLLLPDSFKVRIKLSRRESAVRYIKKTGLVEDEKTINSVMNRLRKKVRSECKRFKALYGVDYRDDSMFDYVTYADDKTPEELYNEIVNVYVEFNNLYKDSGTCSCMALYPSGLVDNPKSTQGLFGIDPTIESKCSEMSDVELYNTPIPVIEINKDYYVVGRYEVYFEQLVRTVTRLSSGDEESSNYGSYKSFYKVIKQEQLPEYLRGKVNFSAIYDTQEGLMFNYPVLPFDYSNELGKVGSSVGF